MESSGPFLRSEVTELLTLVHRKTKRKKYEKDQKATPFIYRPTGDPCWPKNMDGRVRPKERTRKSAKYSQKPILNIRAGREWVEGGTDEKGSPCRNKQGGEKGMGKESFAELRLEKGKEGLTSAINLLLNRERRE